MLYSVAVGYQSFGFTLKMEAVESFWILVSYHNIAQDHNAEDLVLKLNCCENLKSHNHEQVWEV